MRRDVAHLSRDDCAAAGAASMCAGMHACLAYAVYVSRDDYHVAAGAAEHA